MTIPLTSSGGLFVRWGHEFGRLADLLSLRGGTATTNVASGASFLTTFNTIETDFANGTALRQVIEGLYATLNTWQTSQSNLFSAFQTLAQNTLVSMVAIDTGTGGLNLPANTPATQLTSACTLLYALQTLATQMSAAAASVNASSVAAGAQTAVGSPTGNPILVASTKDVRGNGLQYAFPETLTFACSADSVTGGATAGNETLSITGQAVVSDYFSPLWPGGSGIATSVQAVDGSKNNSTGNVLQNSDFFTNTTANNPDNWTLQIGAAGTDVFVDTTNSYTTGGGALKFTGTGSALLDAVTQSFNTAPATGVGLGGTSYVLKPNTVYHVNCWVKTSATPAAGVLEFALVDGTSGIGTIMQNDQSVNQSFTKSLTAVSTSYVNVNGSFQTPAILPTTTPYRLRVRLSTAIDSGKSVFVGRLAMNPAVQIYQGAPWLSAFSGKTNLVGGLNPDTWTMAMTNTQGTFQSWLWRLFNLPRLGVTIPNSGSPTVNDNLVA